MVRLIGGQEAPRRSALQLRRIIIAVALFGGPLPQARADRLPRAVVLAPAAPEALASVKGEVLAAVRAEVEALGVAELGPTPPLGLRDLQLAVGCLSESAECWSKVADELGVEVLLVPSLREATSDLVLELAAFDRRSDGEARRVLKLASGARRVSLVLEEINAMLRALFFLPALPRPPPTSLVLSSSVAPAPARPFVLSPLPWAIAGAASLSGGIIFGALAGSASSDYAALDVRSSADVDRAIALLDTASGRATAANAFYVGAALSAALSLTLWLLEDGEP